MAWAQKAGLIALGTMALALAGCPSNGPGPTPPSPDESCPAVQVLESQQLYPTEVAVNSSKVFWMSDQFAFTNWTGAVPCQVNWDFKDGGSPTSLAPFGDIPPQLLVADEDNVYFTDFGDAGSSYTAKLTEVPLDGGLPIVLATPNYPDALAVDGTYVYTGENTTGGRLLQIPKGGGLVTTLASGNPDPVYGTGIDSVVSDGTSVYWVEGGNQGYSRALKKIPVGGGTPVTLLSNMLDIQSLTVAGGSLYFVAPLASGGEEISSLPIDGADGGLPTPLGVAPVAYSLVVVGPNLYFASEDTSLPQTFVYAMPLDGGAPIKLDCGIGSGTALAADSRWLYWLSNSKAGALFRTALR